MLSPIRPILGWLLVFRLHGVMERAQVFSHKNDAIEVDDVATDLSAAVNSKYGCLLKPRSFFVAWNGVIVLVFDGFPPTLCQFKVALENVVPNLKPENFGSKWPKATLGAVNDDAPKELTLEEFRDLKKICQEISCQLVDNEAMLVAIKTVSIVHYSQRSLEDLVSKANIILEESEEHGKIETSDEEKQRVKGVVGEWDDEVEYLEKVNAPGSRIRSYREESPSGFTCVSFLDPLPPSLQKVLSEVQRSVDKRFPGRYSWLEETSLHCTLRSLAQTESSGS